MRVGVLRFYALKDGPLSVAEVKVVELDGANVAAAICWIETDHPALGGRHRVVAYGRLAREVTPTGSRFTLPARRVRRQRGCWPRPSGLRGSAHQPAPPCGTG
jgi:hypothetical protein